MYSTRRSSCNVESTHVFPGIKSIHVFGSRTFKNTHLMEVEKRHLTSSGRVDSSGDSLTAIESNGAITVHFEYLRIICALFLNTKH